MGMPGDRRLDRPPSDRYEAEPGADAALTAPAASAIRAVGAGVAAAAGWAVLSVVLGGGLAVSAGLLVLAAAGGRIIAVATAWGGGGSLASGTRLALVIGLVIVGFVLGQLGIWAYGRAEGGVMAPIEYLLTTFGIVVPLQLAVALAVGWWTAR